MSKVAIVGSCITRDLWPIVGAEPSDLLYISRTSLPSLFARPLEGVETAQEPPHGLGVFTHRAMVNDLKKRALAALVAYQPTHIIFDFIDERLDLFCVGGTIVTHSWELDVSGYLAQPAFEGAATISRTSTACDLLWLQAADEMAAFIQSTPLRDAVLIVHEAQWATGYQDEAGELRDFADVVEIFQGKPAPIAEHNAMLDFYQPAFRARLPQAVSVTASPDLHLASAQHRWGLSPFHYVDDYYREVWSGLKALGV
ncbi:MAG: DUF6270 domain-containing protein [Pseudomonadota bacterium]|uniref:DUF6270 domain-containing protein n=1 Tax=Phenylobacterium sp. TaxID=1871053 RepID=UPI002719D81B|nr:DUF6270 domain-containing protein [Phenylobacterium sp.]MDO9430057.1 DUF6270 domain-containing protein [Phenylobacterium sp.]